MVLRKKFTVWITDSSPDSEVTAEMIKAIIGEGISDIEWVDVYEVPYEKPNKD